MLAASALLLAAANLDWPAYGGSPEGTRYSPLKQINRSNVVNLREVWRYDTADGQGASQTQPIVVDGVLYGITPKHKAVAIDAATGKRLWQWASGIDGNSPNRGIVYWSDSGKKDRRILTAVRHFVYALDARTGKVIPDFGVNGRIDLRQGLGRDPEMFRLHSLLQESSIRTC